MTLNRFKMLALAAALVLAIPAMATAQGVMFVTGGQVGIGTDTPADKLHVKDGDLRIQQSAAGTNATLNFQTAASNWEIKQNGNTGRLTFFSPGGGAVTASFKFDRQAQENLFRVGILGPDVVDINGRLLVNGTQVNVPDYVFEPDYQLLSIEEQAKSMFENRHLPSLQPGREAKKDGVDVVQFQMGILEELEKAHIYIAQLNSSIKRLEAEIAELKK